MKSEGKLEWLNAEQLRQQVHEVAHRNGENLKSWHVVARNKIPNFPEWRTLMRWMEQDGKHDKRLVAALKCGLSYSKAELEVRDFANEIDHDRVLTENELYLTINQLIDEIGKSPGNSKTIQLCAMHGTDEPRVVQEPCPSTGWVGFVERMQACTMDRTWQVEVLYNVPSRNRRKQILDRLKQARQAENHEVRAYGIEGSVPLLCPMIIGSQDGFLAMNHPRFYRAQLAIYLRGQDRISFINRYWKSLWNNAHTIRSEARMNVKELKQLEREIEINE